MVHWHQTKSENLRWWSWRVLSLLIWVKTGESREVYYLSATWVVASCAHRTHLDNFKNSRATLWSVLQYCRSLTNIALRAVQCNSFCRICEENDCPKWLVQWRLTGRVMNMITNMNMRWENYDLDCDLTVDREGERKKWRWREMFRHNIND